MANNIFQERITPEKPKVLAEERVYVYVPKASNSDAGIASFKDTDFTVNSGEVTLKQAIKDQINSNTENIEDLTDRMDTAETALEDIVPRVETLENTVGTFDSRITNAEINAQNAKTNADDALAKASKAVRYDAQSLTENEKAQARTNIDALSREDIASKVDKSSSGLNKSASITNQFGIVEAHSVSGQKRSDLHVWDTQATMTSQDESNFSRVAVRPDKIDIRTGSDETGISLTTENSSLKVDNKKVLVSDDLNDYYTKAQAYSKEEVNTIVQNINAIQIRNVNNEAINATSSTVQSVATQYIVDNYERQPKQLDGLIITLTDQSNDKVLFVYSETSSIWINVGLNGVDLSNYYTKQETQQYVSQEDNKYIGREQLLGFTVNAVENEVATAVLDSSLSDYSMTNSTGYLFDVIVPTNLATLITKTTKLVLKDKDSNSININCVFEDDKDNSSTFGMLEQITTSSNAGLELEFYGHYSQFTESETVHRVIYTDTVVKGVELVKLEFDGMDIKLDGEVMNYASLRAIMINKLKFATIYYEDFACIYYPMADGSGDAIFFQSVYTINGKNYIGRIIINSDDDIQTTDIEVFNVSGITQTIDSSSTTSQVPSAKAVYDIIGNIDTLLTQIDSGSGV